MTKHYDNLLENPELNISEISKKRKTLSANEDINYKIFNDNMIEWLSEYEDNIRKTINKPNVTVYEHKKLKNILKNTKKEKAKMIDDEYIKKLNKSIDAIDYTFLHDYSLIKKYNANLHQYISETISNNHLVESNTYLNIIKNYIKKACNTTKEEKTFGAILYLLTQKNIVKNHRYLTHEESKMKFMNLFLSSMYPYTKKVLNKIIKVYNDKTNKEDNDVN